MMRRRTGTASATSSTRRNRSVSGPPITTYSSRLAPLAREERRDHAHRAGHEEGDEGEQAHARQEDGGVDGEAHGPPREEGEEGEEEDGHGAISGTGGTRRAAWWTA